MKGSLGTTFIHAPIPYVLFLSRSTVDDGQGKVWAMHITPFLAIGLVRPKFMKPT